MFGSRRGPFGDAGDAPGGEGCRVTANESVPRGPRGGDGGRRGSLSRLNVLIAGTAAIVGLIYGYDLGSIAGALLFLVLSLFAIGFVYVLAPETKGRQLEEIRAYWYNGGSWPDEAEASTRREARTR